jgi:hypothetical protein
MPARGSELPQPAADKHTTAAAVTPSTAFVVNDIDERPI